MIFNPCFSENIIKFVLNIKAFHGAGISLALQLLVQFPKEM
jgi:hypothetical protein